MVAGGEASEGQNEAIDTVLRVIMPYEQASPIHCVKVMGSSTEHVKYPHIENHSHDIFGSRANTKVIMLEYVGQCWIVGVVDDIKDNIDHTEPFMLCE